MAFRPELLLPAGNLDTCLTALRYGADAVYLSGPAHSLRAAASGLSAAELAQAVAQAEQAGSRIYYCLNAYPRQQDLPAIPAALEAAAEAGVHGLIVADPGTFALARSHTPQLPIHVSTQANTANAASAAFWLDQGAQRVNLARELGWEEIGALRAACPDLELEVFIHGAMCLAVSGQCLLSSWLNGRPANQGRCTQPCRFAYRALNSVAGEESLLLVDEAYRRGEAVWEAGQDGDYAAFWAPEDLCLLPWLDWFCRTGVDALKIEGRMKSASYVAHVADVYATALRKSAADCADTEEPTCADGEQRGDQFNAWLAELAVVAGRPLGSGFFLPERRRIALPTAHSAVVGRVGRQLTQSSWELMCQCNWPADRPARLVLPGMRRPELSPGDYGLENHKGERTTLLPCGVRGVLHCEHPDVAEGIFIRQDQEQRNTG